jgi:hypothetical protein
MRGWHETHSGRRRALNRHGNEGFIVDVMCTSTEGTQTISTTFTGDFDTRYHAILKTTFDPPVGAISHMGVNIDGKSRARLPGRRQSPGSRVVPAAARRRSSATNPAVSG